MAKNSIRDFSATAGSNTDIQSVNIDENCPASGINNAIRELMVDLKNVSTGAVNLETPGADQLNVDNLRLDGNTISSTDTNGDITLDPNGTGGISLDSSVVINESGADVDFRVESDGKTHAFFVEGGGGTDGFIGLNESSPQKMLHITKNDSDGIIILDADGNTTDHQICFAKDYGTGGVTGGNYWGIGVDRSENKLVFAYDANSQASLSADAKLLITSDGHFLHGKTSKDFSTAGTHLYPDGEVNIVKSGTPLYVNRLSSNGTVIAIAKDAITQGQIDVSGTTVTYNGGHLGRWSQAADGKRIDGLVKGTVMTNLDQMAVWSHDEVLWTAEDDLPDGVSVGDVRKAAFTEDNEQLNCMAVSSVEGDANVAGVFVNWDEDDQVHTNDMVVAMTGDMVIRIAQGTTVARGDLLMSAGDGTAKPQGDDIIRSKTIAKVTSTTVSHTYDDGSYLVPCVLMAC